MLKNKTLFLTGFLGFIIILIACFCAYQFFNNSQNNTSNGIAQPLSQKQFDEQTTRLTTILDSSDPKASFDYLRTTIKTNPSVARACHPLLHHLGHSAYKKYKDFTKAISYQDGLCNSGFTHGVIEAHFMASDDITTTLQTTCPHQDGKMTFQQWQCNHGMGHGAMFYTKKDVPQALALCESLATDPARISCVNGVFMERFIVVSHTGTHTSTPSDATIELCKQQLEQYKFDCYMYAPTAYLEHNINNYRGAFEECKLAEKEYVSACVYGVGGQALKENVTHPEIAPDICSLATKTLINACMRGAVGILINHYASTAPVAPLCHTIFAQYKETCMDKIESWNRSYSS